MKLTRQHWPRASEFGFIIAFAAAVAIVVNGVVGEPTAAPPVRPILAPIASLATTYCPDRLDVFELKVAQEACIEIAAAYCQTLSRGRDFAECVWSADDHCTIGNTHRSWLP